MQLVRNKALMVRFANLALLIGGFGIGQGSIFLAQTLLVATGRMELLASFGTHFSFAMLGIIAVEAGSLTVLARQASHLARDGGEQAPVWQAYWETTIFRLCMAGIVTLSIVAYSLFAAPEAFSRNYAIAALPAFLFWAFNGAGFLDGLQKSGISGITGSIAYLASAVTLVLVREQSPETAGLALGGALSAGYGLTVLAQYLSLVRSGWKPMLVAPAPGGIAKAFREEFAMLSGLLPGQFYFRIQLTLSTVFLGPNATALLVYAKQIVGAGSQITGFMRRVEFPHLLHHLRDRPQAGAADLIKLQKGSLAFALALTLVIVAASFFMISQFDGFTRQAWLLLSIFGLTVLTEASGQSLVQILFAHGLFSVAAAIRIGAVAMGVAFGYLFIDRIGLTVFVISDFCSHAIVVTLSLVYLARKARQI